MRSKDVKVLFIDIVHPCLQEALEKAGFHCDIRDRLDRHAILDIVDDYDGIVIRSRITLDREFLQKAVKLKFIARSGSGLENIDVNFAKIKGIHCLNAPEGNRDAVAEHAVGMLLSLFNHLNTGDKEVRLGKWSREKNRGIELMGKTVGIIGYGNTGSAFARRLAGFGVEILAHDKYRKGFGNEEILEVSLQEIFDKADVLSLHVPLTEETRYMVNDAFIHQFRKDIWLINTSRGEVVHTADLVNNLEKGKVKGACLDVLEYESKSFERLVKEPAFDYLINCDRVVLSPHVAGWTEESYRKLSEVLAAKIKKAISFKPDPA